MFTIFNLLLVCSTCIHKPDIIARDQWLASIPIGPLTTHQISKITIHHTGLDGDGTLDNRDRVHAIQFYHQSKRHYADVAYHYLIAGNGQIFEGRSVNFAGETNTNYNPSGHLLIALIGNLDKHKPSKLQWLSLISLLKCLVVKYNVRPGDIAGHQDHATNTVCPGRYIQNLIKDRTIHKSVYGVEGFRHCPVEGFPAGC